MKVTKPFDFYNIPEKGWVETKSGTKVLDLTYLPSAKQQCLVGVLDETEDVHTWYLDGTFQTNRTEGCLDLVIAEEVEEVEDEKYYWAIAGSDPLWVIGHIPSALPQLGHSMQNLVRCNLTPV